MGRIVLESFGMTLIMTLLFDFRKHRRKKGSRSGGSGGYDKKDEVEDFDRRTTSRKTKTNPIRLRISFEDESCKW